MRLEDLIPNFRDLGGLPAAEGAHVAPGRLVRTAALLGYLADRTQWLRDLLPGATYFDLRTEAEVERHGSVVLPEGWALRHRPIFDSDLGHPVPSEAFPEALRRHRPIVLEVASVALTAPIVVACALGKDRTGFVVAALLHMLGVAPASIVSDYAQSNDQLARWPVQGTYSRVDADHCVAWLAFLSDNLDPPPATVSELRSSILSPAQPPQPRDAHR